MSIKLNSSGSSHAASLVSSGKINDSSSWSAPSAAAEDEFIKKHGMAEYGKFFLGVDEAQDESNKGRYSFPYSSNFEEADLRGLAAAESRASQNGHSEIASRAKELFDAAKKKLGKDKTENFGSGSTRIRVSFFARNDASEPSSVVDSEPAEMNIYDEIGTDPWDGSGLTDSEFSAALDAIKSNRNGTPPLHLRVNSRGGDVSHGMTMMNLLNEWPNKITTTIDGIAASTASWAFMAPADEVRAHPGSQIFMHDAMGNCNGNAADMEMAADSLNKTSDQIAGMYAGKSGKSKKSFRDMMQANKGWGTLLTGEEAADCGLVDTLIDGKAQRNFSPAELMSMRNRLKSFYNKISAPMHGAAKTTNTQIIMNKIEMLALLNKWGITVPENATDEQIKQLVEKGKPAANAAPPASAVQEKVGAVPNLAELQAQVNKLTQQNSAIQLQAITNRVDELIRNDKLTAAERDDAIALASDPNTGEKYLNSLEKRPAMQVGAPALTNSVQITGDSAQDVQKLVLADHSFRNQFFGTGANKLEGYSPDQKKKIFNEISVSASRVAQAIKASKNKIIAMWNASTIDAGLQRQVILQEMLEEFAVQLLPLKNFSTVFSNVPREGTDTVDVPFYPLATDAANSWDPAVGYSGTGGVVNAKPIYIGGSGTTSGANAPAGYAKDRKWLALSFSSYELASQPWVNWQKLAQQKANKLGVDIFKDIVSRVITAANYGASVKAVPAAAFSGDDVADLAETGTGLNWPVNSRSLVLNHTYRTPLLKDPTFKQYLSYGSTDPLRKAVIQEAYGFENIDIVPNLTNYSPANENLIGWINWMYAMLVATAPIMPTEEVRALMTRYDLATEPQTGLTLEYRRFGNVTLDQTTEVIECSYGAAPGVLTALKRLTSQ
ncbi:MAG: Clp protease ClpP [Patescibacteria group bacterium]|nr:Clp protease ClpP [Patescibacteria group bacterium]